MSKPVFAYIAGQFAPQGKKMGHAGAIISQSGEDSALYKMEALRQAGVHIALVVTDLSDLLTNEFGKKK
jgi:succinyl-CoA synthetase alpha subunit